MQQNRKVDLKDLFCHPLGPVPQALATSNNALIKISQSKLMHELEKGITTTVSVPITNSLFPYSVEWLYFECSHVLVLPPTS